MSEFFIFVFIFILLLMGLFLFSIKHHVVIPLVMSGILSLLWWWSITPIPNQKYFYNIYEIENHLYIKSPRLNSGMTDLSNYFKYQIRKPEDFCVGVTFHSLKSSNGIYFHRAADFELVSKKLLGQNDCRKLNSKQ
jgi:hypothetical protein